MAGSLIGKGGANIKKIRDETDTKIDLPDSGSDSDMITITGREANVKKAADKIQEIQSQMANIVSQVSLLFIVQIFVQQFSVTNCAFSITFYSFQKSTR